MKRLICLLICVLTVILACMPVSAAEEPVVTSMDVQCLVDKNGNYDVTATIDVDFSEASDKIRIPVGDNVKNVRAPGYRISTETEGETTWVVIRGSEGTVGTRTIVLTYRKQNNITQNDDGTQTLHMELRSPYWDWEAQEFTFSISMPAEFQTKPVYRSGYFGEDIPVIETLSSQTIEGSVRDGLLDLESVTMEITVPEDYFKNRYVQGAASDLVRILMIALAVAAGLYWFLLLRNPFLRSLPQRKVAPDGVAAWEFPYVGGNGRPDPVLLFTEWANLGYLTIHMDKHGRVTLKKRIPMSNERKTYECNTFEALFFRSNECPGDTPRCKKLGQLAAKGSRMYWGKRLFSPKSGNVRVVELLSAIAFGLLWFLMADLILPPWLLRIVLMIPALILGYFAGHRLQKGIREIWHREPNRRPAAAWLVLIATVVLTVFAKCWGFTVLIVGLQILTVAACSRGGKRSEDGMDRIAQIHAFRSYLKNINTHQLQLLLNQNSQYFYEMLPYAEALGLGKKFAKKFAHIKLDPCAWLNDGKNPSQTAENFYGDYQKLLRKMRGR